MRTISPLAGKPVPAELLLDSAKLEQDYFTRKPDANNPEQLVSFGTSGHRGNASKSTFNEMHVLAIAQAICEYRHSKGINGPLFMGMDTHATSLWAQRTALSVLAANNVEVVVQAGERFTPTPVISHKIITHNRSHRDRIADGIVITPSHNPPAEAGLKYNPPHGGAADTDVTSWIQGRANELLKANNQGIKSVSVQAARSMPNYSEIDFKKAYIDDLGSVLNMEAIAKSKVKIGVDPLGGASVDYWDGIQQRWNLNLHVVNRSVDPSFSFMSVDHDGKVRMDCSSPYAMASLVRLKNDYAIAFGCDPDADRHGIVSPSKGLMNPNFYLATAVHYLLTHRPQWSKKAFVGKTLVSSALIDRVTEGLGWKIAEVPVGFKWFSGGLASGSFCVGLEESAGASFLRHDGTAWTTDKDGLALGLLAAEILAVTGKEPGQYCDELMQQFGRPYYTRIDGDLTFEERKAFAQITPENAGVTTLAGDPVVACFTHAPFNKASIGGIKVASANGWFAARPSGTELVYKLYGESFVSEDHLQRVLEEAQAFLKKVLGGKL